LKGVAAICLFALLCISQSGCLSLQSGGKTQDSTGLKEAEARIAQLESRLNKQELQAGILQASISSKKTDLPVIVSPRINPAILR
jgi:septal ring factor EnvC (AmiA/AmiB activator)